MPWDRAQDERSIVPHTVEEAYELADAAAPATTRSSSTSSATSSSRSTSSSCCSRSAAQGDLAAVAENTTEKLIRRHPHVFAEAEADGTDDVRSNWDRIKREQEGRGSAGPFADVPENLPGLLYARSSSAAPPRPAFPAPPPVHRRRREARAGRRELREAPIAADPEDRTDEDRDRVEEAIGQLLLATTDLARVTRVDPELTLRRAADALRVQR